MVSCVIRCVALAGIFVLGSGCRMGVPIHVWQPPSLQSTVGKRIVLQGIVGPEQTTKPIREKLLATVPQDLGRTTTIVESKDLRSDSMVRLASATELESSDVTLASVAKHQDVDFLLRGEILSESKKRATKNDSNREKTDLERQLADQRQANLQTEQNADLEENPRLILSWRLTAIGQKPSSYGQPVVIDLESAIERYPDLATLDDPDEILISAAARETYRLITPTIDRQRIQLAIPYASFGSRDVRRGNIEALSGRWAEAELIWLAALEKHPLQAAAVHNLALAAVAGQDFSRAKKLARQAIRLQPTPLHKKTLGWIELRQRDYHKSFNLPDPPEGWFLTQ